MKQAFGTCENDPSLRPTAQRSSRLTLVHRQCHHAQISAANGISARAYLNLNVHLAVLCRKRFMPMSPPGQPPMAPNSTRDISETR